jgi:hypothetical protein
MSLSRRVFLKAAALCAMSGRFTATGARETLYNGITLATPWPPRNRFFADGPLLPPYLADPPGVIPIDVGRQLFVDDFLIEESTLQRTFHSAEYHPASPVLRPATEWERRDEAAERTHTRSNPAAMVFSDGVFYDPHDRQFKMWYMGGYSQNTCLALSDDGITWHRPVLDVVPGTNIVRAELRDSNTVWLDADADRSVRFKMAAFNGSEKALLLSTSRDGIHWTPPARSGPTADRSTMFYNPFRGVWVFSLRGLDMAGFTGRYRRYFETPRFPPAEKWREDEPVLWTTADRLDPPRTRYINASQLYNLDAVAYESLIIGMFTIFRGEGTDREKPNDICVGFSRDGFHWSRPDRRPFIGVSERVGDWNWANVQSAGGCCLVMGDRLYFYVSGRQGVPGTDLPGICSTGLATLRRDGFASISDDLTPDRPVRISTTGTRQLTTRPVRFSGRYLFVNANMARGDLRVEALDQAGHVIEPFSRARSTAIAGVDGTRLRVTWDGRRTLEDLAGAAVRFRFFLNGGRLYSFWVSGSEGGASRGYLGAGGPGYSRAIDA